MIASAPEGAPGYPSRASDLDALPGFRNPPPGYGEAPFWWWTGEDLDVDRLLWQVRELHSKGVSGVQVNYSHSDSTYWTTEAGEPGIFTEAWWKVYRRVADECRRLGMGIGLSTYTLDWPNGAANLFHRLFYSRPELNALELKAGRRTRVRGGRTATLSTSFDPVAVRAYPVCDGKLRRGGVDLGPFVRDGTITWRAPEGEWEIWEFISARKPGSLNPLMAGSGDTVVRGFYQEFEDRSPGRTSVGLNYFFNDELSIGVGKFAWNPDFPAEFARRKGYDLFEVLPAMWEDLGDLTPKVRIDYADVRMDLMEERYFKPIHDWHASRGLLFGCDNNGRGLQPDAYGDYFRATRWYTAPGHDTPGGQADPIKGKVSSSVANLYRRPRVWLEGYHSIGWGAAPESLMSATRENYLYGCTLLNLHGLYYTTYGSHWEWAPPCHHFRMPYWAHMALFLKYFERLSYLMSQGHHVCDVAVIYPVTPYEAELGGRQASDAAFAIGRKLLAAGIDFDYIDHQSLARATVDKGRLVVDDAGASYRALVFPDMAAARWTTMQRAAAFAQAGGDVFSVGAPPSATDRVGGHDAKLAALNEQAFTHERRLAGADELVEAVRNAFTQDVRGLHATVRATHRRVGRRDVYLVMDAGPGDPVEFRAHGRAELWDPWTGDVRRLRVVGQTATGTRVELPLAPYEAQLVVFTPGEQHVDPAPSATRRVLAQTLPDDWRVGFEPTMDNRHGDFRLPVTPANSTIGVEARRFAWARETAELAGTAMRPRTDDGAWRTQLHGYGPQFYLLGPIPETTDPAATDIELAALQRVDPSAPVTIDGRAHHWRPYEFSWRYGKEGDPGHQGFHGLKGAISDHFIRLGAFTEKRSGVHLLTPEAHSRYYLWTSATVSEPTMARILVSRPAPAAMPNTSPVSAPAAVFVNGQRVDDLSQAISLRAGANPTLLRYEEYGESHFVLRRQDMPPRGKAHALAMRWWRDAGVIPFDPYAGEQAAEWFRFVAAPGAVAICVQARSRTPVQAWIDGEPMVDKGHGRFEAPRPVEAAGVVALRLTPHTGRGGGAAIPEPVTVETSGDGVMRAGDWSKCGILNNYSGGVRYRTTFALANEQARGKVELDLGHVVATAEVSVNGKAAGVRVAPPWTFDVTALLRDGENQLEVLVYSTLANHYQTIPSLYRGDPAAGLTGPVRLWCYESAHP